MSPVPQAIKRCDMLLISALAHTKQGRAQAALADLLLAQSQLQAIIELLTPSKQP